MAIEIKVFDDHFLELFDPQEALQPIVTDLIGELGPTNANGPVWHREDQCLYFNNIGVSRTCRYSAQKGFQVVFHNGTKSSGMCVARDGHLLLCEHSTSSLVMWNTDGTGRRVLADYYGDIELNGPHDVIQRSDGLIYFSDPAFVRNYNPTNVYRIIPSDTRAVYMLDLKGGNLLQAADGFLSPNGLCFSPDEKVLYVVDSRPGNTVKAYDVKADGTLERERCFATLENFADGVKVDAEGNLLLAIPRCGLDCYSPEGKRLGFIYVPNTPMNLAWGERDFKTLFITCKTCVYTLRTLVAGHDVAVPATR